LAHRLFGGKLVQNLILYSALKIIKGKLITACLEILIITDFELMLETMKTTVKFEGIPTN
jgi:hypothetical protein